MKYEIYIRTWYDLAYYEADSQSDCLRFIKMMKECYKKDKHERIQNIQVRVLIC